MVGNGTRRDTLELLQNAGKGRLSSSNGGDLTVEQEEAEAEEEDLPVSMKMVEKQGFGCDVGSQQKLFRRLKTRPRGLEDEVISSSSSSLSPSHSSASSSSSSSSSSPCASPKQVALDNMVWAELPHELIDRILACLPPICLFRLRSVCKRWNSVLHERGFLSLLSQLPSHGPCFLMSQRQADHWLASVYSFPLNSWHSLPLSFVTPKAHSLLATAGGLLCFTGLDGRHEELFVCNPLSKQWRRLPEMHHRRQLSFVNICVDKERRCYKIITLGDSNHFGSSKVMQTEIYDSRHNCWIVLDSVPLGTLHSMKSACCGAKLYCLTLSPCGLVAFDLEQGLWKSVPVRMPRSLLDAFLMAGEGDSLLLIGRVGLYSVHQSMRIWELDQTGMEWMEVGRMPHNMFKAFLKSSAESFQCFGHGTYMCFSAQKQQKWLMYDLAKKMWHWFEGCQRLTSSTHKGIKGFFYEPRLDTSVY